MHDPDAVRAWLAARPELYGFVKARYRPMTRRTFDRWEDQGAIPPAYWLLVAVSAASPVEVIEELHGFAPGVRWALTRLDYTPIITLDDIARDVGVPRSTMLKWKSRDRVPAWARDALVAALKGRGLRKEADMIPPSQPPKGRKHGKT